MRIDIIWTSLNATLKYWNISLPARILDWSKKYIKICEMHLFGSIASCLFMTYRYFIHMKKEWLVTRFAHFLTICNQISKYKYFGIFAWVFVYRTTLNWKRLLAFISSADWLVFFSAGCLLHQNSCCSLMIKEEGNRYTTYRVTQHLKFSIFLTIGFTFIFNKKLQILKRKCKINLSDDSNTFRMPKRL